MTEKQNMVPKELVEEAHHELRQAVRDFERVQFALPEDCTDRELVSLAASACDRVAWVLVSEMHRTHWLNRGKQLTLVQFVREIAEGQSSIALADVPKHLGWFVGLGVLRMTRASLLLAGQKTDGLLYGPERPN